MEIDTSYLNRIWIAEAPPGIWSSGPVVIYDFEDVQETIEKYREMDYRVRGPYVLQM